jgi:hypothetical protein
VEQRWSTASSQPQQTTSLTRSQYVTIFIENELFIMAKGRPAGSSNYKNSQFLDAIEQVKPATEFAWQEVGRIYQGMVGDLEQKTVHSMKRHFYKLCNEGKSAPSRLVRKGQNIFRQVNTQNVVEASGYAMGSDPELTDQDEDDDDYVSFSADDVDEDGEADAEEQEVDDTFVDIPADVMNPPATRIVGAKRRLPQSPASAGPNARNRRDEVTEALTNLIQVVTATAEQEAFERPLQQLQQQLLLQGQQMQAMLNQVLMLMLMRTIMRGS